MTLQGQHIETGHFGVTGGARHGAPFLVTHERGSRHQRIEVVVAVRAGPVERRQLLPVSQFELTTNRV
ncbi:MAG TPA: hypothetical protein VND83_00340 [Acidimicrobiales bacterium]|nr:hypothetical protein [Acidimicrobiales bacterium]